MLDLVPLAGARREVADGDRQPGPGGQGGQLGLPQPGAVAVGAAAVRGDQQPPGLRVAVPARSCSTSGGSSPRRTRRCRGRCRRSPSRCSRPGRRPRTGSPCPVRGRGSRGRSTWLGRPSGRHSRPPFLNSPTSSFFLVSTLITGSPAARCSRGLLVDVTELRVPVRVLAPSRVLALACRLNPSSCSSPPTVSAETLCPLPGQLGRQVAGRHRRPAQRRLRIAPPGGSTSASSAVQQPRIGLGPLAAPAGRRARPSGSAPASSSATPSDTVGTRRPAARATVRIPP